jgi:UDP-N-acetylglucosamine 2-epimerase (non-hydrolysing)
MLKVLTIMGTRPEAIKLSPVFLELRKYPEMVESVVCGKAGVTS